jgi:putative ABC transport system ATP-binding protein
MGRDEIVSVPMTATMLDKPVDSPASSPSAVAVYCRGVTKSYGTGSARVTALRGIDLTVKTDELMMLVGPSGCGKTTLISCIAGILDHDDGECLVFGKNFKSMPQAQRTKLRGQTIGFVFQAFNLLPTLTATENAAIPLLINGLGRREAFERAAAMLDKVGLGDRTKALPNQLSGGQQQRVAIARALVHDPKIIVCDEPTSALDHDTGARVMDLLRDVALGHDRALVIVTHDARIFRFADRIAQMDDGKIVRVVDSPQDLDRGAELKPE